MDHFPLDPKATQSNRLKASPIVRLLAYVPPKMVMSWAAAFTANAWRR
jgi:hypothetical protein